MARNSTSLLSTLRVIIIRNSSSLTSPHSLISTQQLPPSGRGFASRAVYKKRKESKQRKEFKARLSVADENFGFARNWTDCKDANKIVATCMQPLEEVKRSPTATNNIKALQSKGATVIGGVCPAKLANYPMISGKNFNSIHIQFPEPNDETKSFFLAAKNLLRGYGVVKVLLEPQKIEEVEKLANAVGLTQKKMEEFVGADYTHYKVPADKDSSAPPPPKIEGEKTAVISAGFKVIHFGPSSN